MFLAGKVEETPRPLKDVILISYEIIHKKDPAAIARIKQKVRYFTLSTVLILFIQLPVQSLSPHTSIFCTHKILSWWSSIHSLVRLGRVPAAEQVPCRSGACASNVQNMDSNSFCCQLAQPNVHYTWETESIKLERNNDASREGPLSP